MRRVIDAHVHVDKFVFEGEIDFSKPPTFVVVPHELVQHMDEESVEKAVIMQHPESAINDVVIDTIRANPGRFRGAMIIPMEGDDCIPQLEENHRRGLTVIKLDMYGALRLYPGIQLDSEVMQQVYTRAEELGIVVAIDPWKINETGYQAEALERMIQKHPGLKFVICHLGYCQAELLKDPVYHARWQEMASLARYGNVCFDVSAMPDMFDAVEKHPYAAAASLVKEFITNYGAEKALWGSDILGELGMGTYRELIDIFEASGLFSEDEKDLLFFGNAHRVYFGE